MSAFGGVVNFSYRHTNTVHTDTVQENSTQTQYREQKREKQTRVAFIVGYRWDLQKPARRISFYYLLIILIVS
jgi:hypothetical protein